MTGVVEAGKPRTSLARLALCTHVDDPLNTARGKRLLEPAIGGYWVACLCWAMLAQGGNA